MAFAVLWTVLFVTALLGMELVAYLSHRYLMHGPLWFLHRSHHVPHDSRLEWNDLFGLVFSLPAIACIWIGTSGNLWMFLPIGAGMTAYGLIYFVFHDVVVHRRFPLRRTPRSAYMRRIIKAHLMHHRTHQREGAQSFGFLYARPDPARR